MKLWCYILVCVCAFGFSKAQISEEFPILIPEKNENSYELDGDSWELNEYEENASDPLAQSKNSADLSAENYDMNSASLEKFIIDTEDILNSKIEKISNEDEPSDGVGDEAMLTDNSNVSDEASLEIEKYSTNDKTLKLNSEEDQKNTKTGKKFEEQVTHLGIDKGVDSHFSKDNINLISVNNNEETKDERVETSLEMKNYREKINDKNNTVDNEKKVNDWEEIKNEKNEIFNNTDVIKNNDQSKNVEKATENDKNEIELGDKIDNEKEEKANANTDILNQNAEIILNDYDSGINEDGRKQITISKDYLVTKLKECVQEYINFIKNTTEDLKIIKREEINNIFDLLRIDDENVYTEEFFETPEAGDQEIIDEDDIKYLSEPDEILDEIYNLITKFDNLKYEKKININMRIRKATNQLLDELNLAIKNRNILEVGLNENDSKKYSNLDSQIVPDYLDKSIEDSLETARNDQLDPVLSEDITLTTDIKYKKEANPALDKYEQNFEDTKKEHNHEKTLLNVEDEMQLESSIDENTVTEAKYPDKSENNEKATKNDDDEIYANKNIKLQQLFDSWDKLNDIEKNNNEKSVSEQEEILGSDVKNESFESEDQDLADYEYVDDILDKLAAEKSNEKSVEIERVVPSKSDETAVEEESTTSSDFIDAKDLTPQQYDELMKQFKLLNSKELDTTSDSFDRNVAAIHVRLCADEPTVVTSPNYPSPYPSNNIVDWIFEGDGQGIELNITDFVVNGAIGDYVLVKPGGIDESGTEGLVFTYSLTSPRRYRFLDVNRMFVRFESKLGLAFATGFEMSLKMIKPPKTNDEDNEDEELEVILPPLTAMYTVHIGGISLAGFKEIQEQFRIILADMATMYAHANRIDIGVNTTAEVTQINSTSVCNIHWPNYDTCISVRFGVPLVNESGTTGRLHEEDLENMWVTYVDRDPFATKLMRLGIGEFDPPSNKRVLSAWLVIGSFVLVSVALLAFALWRFSCIEEYRRMPAFSDTESVQSGKRYLDLYPTPHQSLPPLYEDPPFAWDQNNFGDASRVDMGGFTNRNFVDDELFDIDSDQDVGDARDRNARSSYNV